jgi:moderate conductance mechanosensitive channel
MLLKKYFLIFCCGLLCFLIIPAFPAYSQLPTIQDLVLYSNNLLQNNSDNEPVASCIRIDGRCAFKIAFPKTELSGRVNEIQYRLNEIKKIYLQKENADLQIDYKQENSIASVYITINKNPTRLLTITQQDANLQGVTIKKKAELVVSSLEEKLVKAKQQRESSYLIRQGVISLNVLVTLLILNYLLHRQIKTSRTTKNSLQDPEDYFKLPLLTYLIQRQNWHLQEIKYRFLQILQLLLWLVGIFLILGLFPQSRSLQLLLITSIRLPLRICLIALITYILIRLAYILVNNLASTIIGSQFVLSPRANKRLQLRVNTISQATKSIITIVLLIVSFLIALTAIGINTAPFLAGAGIIGLALSFASQSILKDAINGFLIIFEDQYAVGDIIHLNGVGGMVENINLRITQIRDAEGRLITIPNSEVRIVSNLSSQWSRADLNIPLSYEINITHALKIINEVATAITQDKPWQEYIIEPPQILGVDDFSDRGIIVRLWIKTEPLKQWEVAREFRRRLQIALTEAGIPLSPPQQQILIEKETQELGFGIPDAELRMKNSGK